jgi:lipopolysaccharide export system protein LptA
MYFMVRSGRPIKKNRLALWLVVFGCCCLSLVSVAQVAVPFKSKTNDSVQTVYIWHTDTLREMQKDSVAIQSLFGHVKLQSGKTLFYCDSLAINHKENFMEAFGNVHINDNDSTDIYSQYMKYFVDTKYIIFQKKVSLKDGRGTLTTEELTYDMNSHIGNYVNGGKVVNKKTTVTSKEGTYYADTKDVFFKKDVVLKDPAYDLTADSLLYNSDQQLATFITTTFIRDSSGRTIKTKEGFYDLKNHRAQFGKRPTITDGSQAITADSVKFDDSLGLSIAHGNAVYRDTVQGFVVISNSMVADKKNNTLLATLKPLMILKTDKDSIYIRADTLYSGKIPDSVLNRTDSVQGMPIAKTAHNPNDSSLRYLQAYHHVRIFSDSLQAVADSLYYSGLDSIFRLYTNPIAWAGGFQTTGDTMFMYTKNKKPDRLYVFENGLVVGKTADNMYNQVKGNTINGYFKDGAIDFMRAKGSAESVYYIKDDSMALVGVNRVNKADVIDMIFKDKALFKVVLRNDADGVMYPIKKVNFDEMKLRNFKWLEDLRPKSKFELFEN